MLYNCSFQVHESPDGKMYVSPGDEDVLLRICASAHRGFGRHRGYTKTCEVIKVKLYRPTTDAVVKAVLQKIPGLPFFFKWRQIASSDFYRDPCRAYERITTFYCLYIVDSTRNQEYILILNFISLNTSTCILEKPPIPSQQPMY